MKALLAAVIGAGLLIVAGPARACSCAVVSARQHLAAASVVFAGEAVTVTTTEEGASIALFDVRKVYKGDVAHSVSVRTTDEGGCRVPFIARGTYVVFADAHGEELTAQLCGGTTEDRTYLEREGVTPIREYAGGATPTGGAQPDAGAGDGNGDARPGSPSRATPLALAWLSLATATVLLLRVRSKDVSRIGRSGA